jgi:sirohydrochlorin cobaltochelatase
MKTLLVLFAHGSRDPQWRAPFERFCQSLQAQHGTDAVTLAYMEMAEPTVQQVVAPAVAQGVTQVILLPLFMASGAHVAHDIPEQVAALKAQHPGLVVTVLPPVGEHPQVVAAMAHIAADALNPQ